MAKFVGIIKKGDIAIFFLFNKRMHCVTLNYIMKYITELGSLWFSLTLTGVLAVFNRLSRHIGLEIGLTLLVSQIFVQGIKRLVNRPRPSKSLVEAMVIKPTSCQYSFPSGHTSAAFASALVLAYNIPILGMVFFSVAFMVGISRIYLGNHYPTDVVVGSALSYISFLIVKLYLIPIILS